MVVVRFLKNDRRGSRFLCKNERVSNIGMSKSGGWDRIYNGNWPYRGIIIIMVCQNFK